MSAAGPGGAAGRPGTGAGRAGAGPGGATGSQRSAGPGGGPGSLGGTYTVAELAEALRSVLDRAFPTGVWVAGEIGGISRSARGAVFFDLVEPGEAPGQPRAKVSVVLFSQDRDRVNAVIRRHGNAIRMTEGVKVRIQGMLDYHPPTGRLQVRMAAIDPAHTLGLMVAEREVLMQALAREGLLRANAGRPLAPVPLRVGLVTSMDSAAHADVMKRLASSGFAFKVTEVHAAVQGARAPEELAAAIAAAAGGADVVAVVRGGGSRTDLAAFDHQTVARAIAACPRPVFTGIGHEIDRSVADEAAHTACPTPTAAAAALIERVEGWLAGLDETARAVEARSRAVIAGADHAIAAGAAALAETAAGAADRADRRLAAAAAAFGRVGAAALDRAAARLETASARLEALDPVRVLKRGWSITRRADGRVVRSVADAAPGEAITTTVADGTLVSTIRGPGPTE